jgi:hypothetical protein
MSFFKLQHAACFFKPVRFTILFGTACSIMMATMCNMFHLAQELDVLLPVVEQTSSCYYFSFNHDECLQFYTQL